jgi:hypothetical protein
MTEDDMLFGFRLRCLTLADELGNVSAACRAIGIERSTYYRWRRRIDRFGMEALRGGARSNDRSGEMSPSCCNCSGLGRTSYPCVY